MDSENELANSENEMEIDLSEYAAPQKNRLTERRNAVVGNDDVDLMLARRTKKKNYEIPETAFEAGGTFRYVLITEKNYSKLIEEIKGKEIKDADSLLANPARPEIEILTVGVFHQPEVMKPKKTVMESKEPNPSETEDSGMESNASEGQSKIKMKDKKKKKSAVKKKKKIDFSQREAIEQIDGNGVEILYDHSKRLFITSERYEDMLLLSLKHHPKETNSIHHSTVLLGSELNFSVNDNLRQKLWRRFIKLKIAPKLVEDERMSQINPRYVKFLKSEHKKKEQAANANRVYSVEELSTTSDSENEDGKKDKGKKNKKK